MNVLTPPMDPEIKKTWLDALRSGDYEQGTGALRIGDKYCCLGVLCDLAVKAGLEIEVKGFKPYPDDPPTYNYDGDAGTLPESVSKWAGLTDGNPLVKAPEDYDPDSDYYDGTEALGGLNDAGLTFDQIANLIDVQL